MAPEAPPARLARPRLRSLDVFRGATIALMILVNNAGDWGKTYAPLLHAEWHGWTPTDLVFPFFLFILGVAIPLALGPRRDAGREGTGALHRKILRRAALLFALGLLLNWFPFDPVIWQRPRIPGVLQRIAIVYLVAALAFLHFGRRGRLLLCVALLGGYWALMLLVPVPGFGAGNLSPEGNLAAWLDHRVLGQHTWRYAPGPGDPEGILSTLPAIVSALLGIFAGERLRRSEGLGAVRPLAAWGALLGAAGLLLAPLFPINKNLWSPTYVLFTGGAALAALALLHAFVDRPGSPRGAGWARPFAIFGSNAIAVYVGSGLLARVLSRIRWPDGAGGVVALQKWLYEHLCAAVFPDYIASLVWALGTVALWFTVAIALDRRRIYLRV